MLTRDQYESVSRLVASYRAINPTPDSRYGQRLAQLLTLMEEYERAHAAPLTHEDIQARVDRARGGA